MISFWAIYFFIRLFLGLWLLDVLDDCVCFLGRVFEGFLDGFLNFGPVYGAFLRFLY